MLPVLSGWFKKFCDDWFDAKAQSTEEEDFRFELFSSYHIINTSHRAFEPPFSYAASENFQDNRNDIHVDGAAIFINGKHCSSEEQLEDFERTNQSFDVTVHLLQAKNRSKCLDSGEIEKFLAGARAFLDDNPWDPQMADGISDLLIENQRIFAKCFNLGLNQSPRVLLHWSVSAREDATVCRRDVDKTVWKSLKDLEDSKRNVARSIELEFYGQKELVELVDRLTVANKCSLNIPFPQRVSFPSNGGHQGNSFFAFVEGTEFLKVIAPDGELDEKIFSENVRDFQGTDTPAYQGMDQTLRDHKERPEFVFRNNGITIIAEKIDCSANCKLENYQIVNGCQTSNAIFANRDNLEEVFVPVRFVEVEDEALLDRITYSTNSQNEVKPQEMVSRTQMARDLEKYAERSDITDPIAFERRIGQFSHSSARVPKNRILQRKDFTSAYVACVLGRPHHAIGYFDRYMPGKKDDIWSHNEFTPLVFATGYLANRVFRSRLIPSELLALKFHILYFVFRDAWPSFADQYTRLQSTGDSEDAMERFLRTFNRNVEKVVQFASDDQRLKESVEAGVKIASQFAALDEFSPTTPSGKVSRSQTKTEGATVAFFELIEG